jgi:sugar phosphate isomerase/epimerase
MNPTMNRRGLLGAFAGLAASATAKAGPTPRGWKTAVGLNGFASSAAKYGKTYPIWEVADFAARQGFDGVELVADWPAGGYPPPDDDRRVRAMRRFWDGYGLQIFSIQHAHPGAFDRDPAMRKAWLDAFTGRAELARRLGSECIGLWPVGGLGDQPIDRAIDRCSASFREAARIAGENGLLASFEIEPVFVFNTEDHLRRIHAGAGHPNLGVMYDVSHFDLMSGSTGRPHEMLSRIGVDKVGYVHFTDTDGTLRDGATSKHLPAGDGHVDIPASLRTLKEGGFRGWLMVDAWEIPDPYDACVKAMRALRAIGD